MDGFVSSQIEMWKSFGSILKMARSSISLVGKIHVSFVRKSLFLISMKFLYNILREFIREYERCFESFTYFDWEFLKPGEPVDYWLRL